MFLHKESSLRCSNRWLPHPWQAQPGLRPLFLLHQASPTLGVCTESLTPLLGVQKCSLCGSFGLISVPTSGLKLMSGPHPGVQSPAQSRGAGSVPGAADTESKILSLHGGSQDVLSLSPEWKPKPPSVLGPVKGRGLDSLFWVLPPPAICLAPTGVGGL